MCGIDSSGWDFGATRQFNTNVIIAAVCQFRTNPEGIESFSP